MGVVNHVSGVVARKWKTSKLYRVYVFFVIIGIIALLSFTIFAIVKSVNSYQETDFVARRRPMESIPFPHITVCNLAVDAPPLEPILCFVDTLFMADNGRVDRSGPQFCSAGKTVLNPFGVGDCLAFQNSNAVKASTTQDILQILVKVPEPEESEATSNLQTTGTNLLQQDPGNGTGLLPGGGLPSIPAGGSVLTPLLAAKLRGLAVGVDYLVGDKPATWQVFPVGIANFLLLEYSETHLLNGERSQNVLFESAVNVPFKTDMLQTPHSVNVEVDNTFFLSLRFNEIEADVSIEVVPYDYLWLVGAIGGFLGLFRFIEATFGKMNRFVLANKDDERVLPDETEFIDNPEGDILKMDYSGQSLDSVVDISNTRQPNAGLTPEPLELLDSTMTHMEDRDAGKTPSPLIIRRAASANTENQVISVPELVPSGPRKQ